MKKISILLIALLSLLGLLGFTEKTLNNVNSEDLQTLLMSKEWKNEGAEDGLSCKFTATEREIYFEGKFVGKSKYYISKTNCYQKPIDLNKIGKETNGEYFITHLGCNRVEITNSNKIKFHHLDDDSPSPYHVLVVK